MSQLGAFLKTGALSDLLKGTAIQTKPIQQNQAIAYEIDALPAITTSDLKITGLKIVDGKKYILIKALWYKKLVFGKLYLSLPQKKNLNDLLSQPGFQTLNKKASKGRTAFEKLQDLLSMASEIDYEKNIYEKVDKIEKLKNNTIEYKGFIDEPLNVESNETMRAIRDEFSKIYIKDFFKFRNTNTEPVLECLFKNLNVKGLFTEYNESETLHTYINNMQVKYKNDVAGFLKSAFDIIWQLLYCIKILNDNKIQHNDLHANNIFVKTNMKRINYENDDFNIVLDAAQPRLLLFDWDLSFSEGLKNDKLDKPGVLCQYYGVCDGLHAKVDSYRFVFSIIERRLMPICKFEFEDALPHLKGALLAFFVFPNTEKLKEIKDKGISKIFESDHTVMELYKYIKHFPYHLCNKSGDRCIPFPSEQPYSLKPVGLVLRDFKKLYMVLYGREFTP